MTRLVSCVVVLHCVKMEEDGSLCIDEKEFLSFNYLFNNSSNRAGFCLAHCQSVLTTLVSNVLDLADVIVSLNICKKMCCIQLWLIIFAYMSYECHVYLKI